MVIRDFREADQKAVEEIFASYWTDPEFLRELSGELQAFVKGDSTKDLGFFIAEENGEILGVIGFKELADYLKPYAATERPIELYVVAVKNRREGIGQKLKQRFLEEVQKLGFSEVLLYSPDSHKESWGFHDTLDFERAGAVTPPEDEIGHVWRKVLWA